MLRLLLSFLFTGALLLPDTAAHLRGKVNDPSKRPIPSAQIVVNRGANQQAFSGETNPSGQFDVALPPGRYTVTVKRDGFEDQTVRVTIGRTDQQIAVLMPLKAQTVSINVTDQTTKLETATDSHQDALKLSPSQLSGLPVKDGDILSGLALFANPSGGQSPTIIVDGMERTDGATLTSSQVQEVRLNNNAYSAEFPKPGKDRIEIDTKAGSSSLHGGFTLRARNAIFDARNPFASAKPSFSRNGYELNLSGPLVSKKLFFFLSADRENQQQVQPILAYLPSGLLNTQVLAPFTRDLLLGRLDWQQSESHRLSGKYEYHQDEATNVGVGGFVLPEAGRNQYHRDYRVEIQDQYILSATAINNFRLALGTNYQRLSSQSDAPSVVVPGSFQQGGAQIDERNRETRYEFQDIYSVVKGSLTVKAGADVKLHPFQNYYADNFGGTYQFASLGEYEVARPLLYTFNSGNPEVNSQQNDYAWFLQAEKQFSRVTLFAGVRHEFQSHFQKYGNLAPRASTSIALEQSRKTILRVGGGVFYDRRPPLILQQVTRFNGFNMLQYLATNPAFPFTRSAGTGNFQLPTIYQFDEALTLPRIFQTSATLERTLPGGIIATVDYTYQRGDHLFRTRNINAPLPVTLLRPDPNAGNIDQIESSASSRANIVNVTLKSPPQKHYQLFLQYTLSYLGDDTDSVFGPPPPGGMLAPGASAGNLFSLPANNYDLRPEWGPADNDIRHRFGLAGTFDLPWRLSLGTLTSVQSALPYNITTGFDNNGDTDPNDRPGGVTRNTARQAGLFTIDLHLARMITFEGKGHKVDTQIAVDSFNVLNHTNPSSYVGVQTSPLFGRPNAAYNGREMQFSLQVHF